MEHNPHGRETLANMVRLCRPGGLVTVTCATVGRREHGTTRTNAGKSPLTEALAWEHYRNLTEDDVRSAIVRDGAFSQVSFGVNWNSYDLYCLGPRAGADGMAAAQWPHLAAAVDAYLRGENRRCVCRYRAFAARAFGDRWFVAWRKIAKRLHLRPLKRLH